MAQSLFPLRLSAFEEYMVKDDWPAYPMNYVIRLRFQERLSPDVLQQSLNEAAVRHPLLCCRIEQIGRNRHQWQLLDDPAVRLTWSPPVNSSGFPIYEWLDLKRRAGLDVSVIESDRHTDLCLRIHHACCDGTGSAQYVTDFLLLYHALANGNEARLPVRDADLLRRRASYGMNALSALWLLPLQLPGMLGTWQFLTRRPLPVVEKSPPDFRGAIAAEFPAVLDYELPGDQLDALRNHAKAHGATTFELLCQTLLLSLRDFRTGYHACHDTDWLRLTIPVSLRSAKDAMVPAANIVSMVFLERRCGKLDGPGLLSGISAEMRRIKQWKLGLTFVLANRLLHRLPTAFDALATTHRCTSSCVITYVGRVLADLDLPRSPDGKLIVGGNELLRTDGPAPIRAMTWTSFSFVRYANQMNLTLHYDPRALSSDQGTELMQIYQERLQALVGRGGRSRSA